MGTVSRCGCAVFLTVLLGAGCGTADPASDAGAIGPLGPSAKEAGALTPEAAASPATSAAPSLPAAPAASADIAAPAPAPEVEAASAAAPEVEAASAPTPEVEAASAAAPGRPDSAALARAAADSPFHIFGDDTYTWDDRSQVVIHKVPVGHRGLQTLREHLGLLDGAIEDTEGTRLWLQECARRQAGEAIGAPEAVYGAVTAQGVYACMGGLARIAQLLARYWWTDAGVECVASAAIGYAHRGDPRPRPLAVCPSIGYDPAGTRPGGWLASRCAQIVAANPNPGYPTDPTALYEYGNPLPSCWAPLVESIEIHAAEGVEIGRPDSPHDCFHAFLGYVWARQTGRESRSPDDLAIGCSYRAFEAAP